MLARAYNIKIEIWKETESADGFGGYSNTETFVKKVWCDPISKGAGYKFRNYGLNKFKNPVIFAIRGKNNTTITEQNFIVYKGKKYAIKGVDDNNLEGLEFEIYADET